MTRKAPRSFRFALRLAAVLFVCLVSACKSQSKDSTKASASASVAAKIKPPPTKPEFVRASADRGPVDQFIREQLEQAKAEQMSLLVYVGATWCEPCQYFHQAVERGELDQLLSRTRLLEFDEDIHSDALHAAGYEYKFIPVIAVPATDGRSSGRLIAGSIKGPRAVQDNLVPRLSALLDNRALD